MLEFLPNKVKDALRFVNGKMLYELRLRAEKATIVNYAGAYRYLSAFGLTEKQAEALVCSYSEISDTVYAAGKFSVYSVEEQIKRGFITAEHGERIGLAGEFVYEKGNPLSIRKIQSLCIRVPHEIIGCGREIYERCLTDRLRSVLIVSPPGFGKTTILRDLTRMISENTKRNILVCDERGELSAGELGATSDVLLYADKERAFEAGIRAMRPDLIVTDELSAFDMSAVRRAISAGVKTIATAHFDKIETIEESFLGAFERYVVLRTDEIGALQGVYDEKGKRIG
ncbi:MAG: hypothetical protein IJ506_05585 [Clostridia bacterium]|nr:hypothetical protein [Clostridia bacterium]